MKKFPYIAAVALTMATWQGCKENDINADDIDTDASRAISVGGPILNSTFSVDELLEELTNEGEIDSGVISKDTNGVLYYNYYTDVDMDWSSFVLLANTSYSDQITASSFLAPLKAAAVDNLSHKMKMNEPGTRYDHLLFRSGSAQIQINVPPGITGTLEFTVPQFTKKSDGSIFSKTFDLSSSERTYAINLDAYKAVFAQGEDSSYIEIKTRAALEYEYAQPIPVTFTVSLSDMDFEEIYGYFGEKTESNDFELDFSFFEEYDLEDQVSFADIDLQLESKNYIGVPFKIQINDAKFTKRYPWGSWDLTINPDYIFIETAGSSYSTNYFTINKDNSNVVDILNRFPDKLTCTVSGTSNPDGEPANTNFIKKERKIENTLRLMFPFWFKTELYEREDEVDFDFNDIIKDAEDEVDGIENAKIIMDFKNGFPFQIGLQLEVIDGNGNRILDLLPDGQTIRAATPSAGGTSNQPVSSTITTTLTKEQISLMRNQNARKIIIRTNAITYNQGADFVKLYGADRLDTKIYFEIKAQLPN
ncbi:MAG: hypothetical protein QM786_10115 [Breznakibacter sp.]